MNHIYFIGGSPCSGKSTVAEYISKKYDMYYFKVDDFLEQYTEIGYAKNYPICKKQYELSPDAVWLRNPEVQCKEEFIFYDEIFQFVLEDLQKLKGHKAIIAEGAAFLPKWMKQIDIQWNHYLAIVPTKVFQVTHYQEREWIHDVLKDCRDKNQAFENWMERDALLAKEIERQASEKGYQTIVNDGTLSVNQIIKEVCKHFEWEG